MAGIIVVIFIALLLLYLFLVCPRIFHKPDRTPLCGVHYAHRGLFDNDSDAPENSLNAFQKAVDAGYGIELDVQLSKDDVPVVFHDASLERVCGVSGNVWDYTLEELRQMRLAHSEQTIPTFEEALHVVDGKVPLIIEYKMDRPSMKVCVLCDRILKQYKGVYCMESFFPFAVRWYRKNRPEIVRGQLSADFRRDGMNGPGQKLVTYLLSNFLARPDFIAYRHEDAKNLSRRLCRKLGALSVAWTIRSREQYERAKDKFDLFIFDGFLLTDPVKKSS